jgi:lipopolysaccharide heptosyltransferase II
MRIETLRQHAITALCKLLHYPFALLDLASRPLHGRARQHPRSIVLLKPCCIGDVLMTTTLLAVLKASYPDATITYVTGTWSKTIAEHHPAVGRIIDCGTVGIPGRYTLQEYRKLVRQLRQYRFDMALVLDRSPMMTLLPFLAHIPRRVGPDSLGRGFSLTDRVPVSADRTQLQHQADIYLDLARALKLPIEQPRMQFVTTEQERASIEHATRMRIAVFPGGGSNPGMDLTAKRWPADRYRALIERLVQTYDVQVLLTGGPSDVELNQSIIEGLNLPAERVRNMAGKMSFGETAALTESCALFIGNDSSPMHLAAAVGIPVIAIFGPTSPAEYGPYPLDDPQHIALWKNPTGQPCFFLGKMQPCSDCTCMTAITVDDVWQAVEQLLAGKLVRNAERQEGQSQKEHNGQETYVQAKEQNQ